MNARFAVPCVGPSPIHARLGSYCKQTKGRNDEGSLDAARGGTLGTGATTTCVGKPRKWEAAGIRAQSMAKVRGQLGRQLCQGFG